MPVSPDYRSKAAEAGDLIRSSTSPSQIRKHLQALRSLFALAQNEEWLADSGDKLVSN
jgi:hypothetical protein